jgi:hypothetical protein
MIKNWLIPIPREESFSPVSEVSSCQLNSSPDNEGSSTFQNFVLFWNNVNRPDRPRGLKRGSSAARLLGCRFETRRWHIYLSLGSVVCCQVEVFVSGWSLVQRSPTECGVSNWVWSWSLYTQEALAHWWLLRHGGRNLSAWCLINQACG